MKFYFHFSLIMGRSPGFRAHCMLLNALFRLALATPPVLKTLSSQHTIAHRTVLQKVPYHTLMCSITCRHKVSILFHSPSRGSPFHLSFTVLYAIGHWVVFRVGGWSPIFRPGFTCLAVLWNSCSSRRFSSTYLTLFGWPSHAIRLTAKVLKAVRPEGFLLRFVFFRVRSPLLTESRLMSLPRPT